MSENLKPLNISMRAYSYIKRFAISSLIEALVELITNSDDAYKSSNNFQIIEIEVIDEKTIKCRDFATGLNSENLEKNFLQVGNYTSIEGNRGFFSRGAKDVSALGDVIFETIKDDKYSSCIIKYNSDAGMLESDISVLDQQEKRIDTGLSNNGLVVTLNLTENNKINDIQKLKLSIEKHYSLRNILSDPDKELIFIHNQISERIQYTYPKSNEILNMQYKVLNMKKQLSILKYICLKILYLKII